MLFGIEDGNRPVAGPFDNGLDDVPERRVNDEIDTVVMDHANPQIEQLCASHDIELLVATL